MKIPFLSIIIIYSINYKCSKAFLSSNKSVVTGEIKYVCVMFRDKNYVFDDLLMPDILTFCSCAVIHINWAITAQRCFVNEDWLITVILTPFKDKPENSHRIVTIVNRNELTLLKVNPKFNTEPILFSHSHIKNTMTCDLIGLSSPEDKAVQGHPNYLLYKVWQSGEHLLQTNIEALYYKNCKEIFNNSLSEYKRRITTSTLCINPLKDQYLEPCAFDRGAPIICDRKLQAVLIYERPLPLEMPLHLPTGCYGNIKQSVSIYAESMTSKYFKWINKTIHMV